MGVSKNRGTPKWMVYNMENPVKMDDLGLPLFLETSIYMWNNLVAFHALDCSSGQGCLLLLKRHGRNLGMLCLSFEDRIVITFNEWVYKYIYGQILKEQTLQTIIQNKVLDFSKPAKCSERVESYQKPIRFLQFHATKGIIV